MADKEREVYGYDRYEAFCDKVAELVKEKGCVMISGEVAKGGPYSPGSDQGWEFNAWVKAQNAPDSFEDAGFMQRYEFNDDGREGSPDNASAVRDDRLSPIETFVRDALGSDADNLRGSYAETSLVLRYEEAVKSGKPDWAPAVA